LLMNEGNDCYFCNCYYDLCICSNPFFQCYQDIPKCGSKIMLVKNDQVEMRMIFACLSAWLQCWYHEPLCSENCYTLKWNKQYIVLRAICLCGEHLQNNHGSMPLALHSVCTNDWCVDMTFIVHKAHIIFL
jgi:hypothetical protein